MNKIKPSVILFDVNETLLDMKPLKQKVNNLLGSKGFRIWFGMLLHYSLVDNCTNQYHDFSALAAATLDMACKALDKAITENEKTDALSVIKKLKPHADVEKGLTILKAKGLRLAALTNSTENVLIEQLTNGNLMPYFEKALSIDSIKKYKPALETYAWAAEQLSVNPADIVMVAAHGWDIAGASFAGLQTAFIDRKGQSLYTLSSKPDFSGKDLIEVANAITGKN
ncbi:MAG: haloacid dehalogenase type II [Bacteroidota bacterium]|nr:haloacid dehalogenase type II [Bacteroidota bacterium]